MQLDLLSSVSERKDTRGFAVELVGAEVEVLTGKEKGVVSDGKLPAQRLCHLRFGQLRSVDYNAQIEVHPELVRNGNPQFVRIFEPQEVNELEVFITPRQQIDLNQLPYILRVYLNE